MRNFTSYRPTSADLASCRTISSISSASASLATRTSGYCRKKRECDLSSTSPGDRSRSRCVAAFDSIQGPLTTLSQANGQKTVGQPINKILQSVFDVLTFEKVRRARMRKESSS